MPRLPLVEETATIRRKAMEIQYGNHIAYLDAQTKLVDQQNERIVQQRKLVEIEAARAALEQQIEQTRSGFERQVLSDLSDAEKKVEQLEPGRRSRPTEDSTSRSCARRSTARCSSSRCIRSAAW